MQIRNLDLLVALLATTITADAPALAENYSRFEEPRIDPTRYTRMRAKAPRLEPVKRTDLEAVTAAQAKRQRRLERNRKALL